MFGTYKIVVRVLVLSLFVFLQTGCGSGTSVTNASSSTPTSGTTTDGTETVSAGKSVDGVTIGGNIQAPTTTDTTITVGSSVSKATVTEILAKKGNITCKRYDGTEVAKGIVSSSGEITDVIVPLTSLDEGKQVLCEVTLSDGRKLLNHYDLTNRFSGESVVSDCDMTTTLAAQQVLFQCHASTTFNDLSECAPKVSEKTIKPWLLFEKYKRKAENPSREENNLVTALKAGMASKNPPKPSDINKILEGSAMHLLDQYKKLDSSLSAWEPNTSITQIQSFMSEAIVEKAPTIIPSGIDRTGLVLYFPFNGNAMDESGNENHGTVYNATLATDRFDKENSAYRFRGAAFGSRNGDYIETRASPSLDIRNAITLAAWVKHDKAPQGGQIINGPKAKYRLSAWSGNPNGYGLELYDGPPYIDSILNGLYSKQHFVHEHMGLTYNFSLNPPLDQWIHVAATWDGQKMMIYRNCALGGTSNYAGVLPAATPSTVTLGVLNHLKDRQWFSGFMDEVYIFNRALSESEIKGFCNEKPKLIKMAIDIKPDGVPNSINPRSKGKIPVALFSTAKLDVTTRVNQSSLTFGRTGDEQSFNFCNPEDVNKDGYMDLVCHFNTPTTVFQKGDVEGFLKGQTTDKIPIIGSDSVKIVPP